MEGERRKAELLRQKKKIQGRKEKFLPWKFLLSPQKLCRKSLFFKKK